MLEYKKRTSRLIPDFFIKKKQKKSLLISVDNDAFVLKMWKFVIINSTTCKLFNQIFIYLFLKSCGLGANALHHEKPIKAKWIPNRVGMRQSPMNKLTVSLQITRP